MFVAVPTWHENFLRHQYASMKYTGERRCNVLSLDVDETRVCVHESVYATYWICPTNTINEVNEQTKRNRVLGSLNNKHIKISSRISVKCSCRGSLRSLISWIAQKSWFVQKSSFHILRGLLEIVQNVPPPHTIGRNTCKSNMRTGCICVSLCFLLMFSGVVLDLGFKLS